MAWDIIQPLSALELADILDMPEGRLEFEARTFRIKHNTNGVPWTATASTLVWLAAGSWLGATHLVAVGVGFFAFMRWIRFAERFGSAAGYEEGLNRGHAIAVLSVYGVTSPKAEKEFWAEYHKAQEDRFTEVRDRPYGVRQ